MSGIGPLRVNFRVSGQKINIKTSVKYLGIHLSNSLTWEIHFKNLQTKLNTAIGLLSKIRHYTPKSLLKTIYFSLFNSHLLICMSDLGTIQSQIVSRDRKITRQSNSYNQFLTKRCNCERGLQHTPQFLKYGTSYHSKMCFWWRTYLKKKSPLLLWLISKHRTLNICMLQVLQWTKVPLYQ